MSPMYRLAAILALLTCMASAQVAGSPGVTGGNSGTGGSGTVTSVSVTTGNGVSGAVANSTTTPAITLTLGAITPTSTNGVSAVTMAFLDATSSVQTQMNTKAPTASPTLTGTPDASGATQFKLPVGAGFVTAANGEIGYDTTNKNWHLWANGADALNAVFSGALTTGHCPQISVSASVTTLVDSGSTNCGGGGSTAWSAITNPAGNLALSMGSNTSIFSTTTALAQMFTLKNTTAAVVGTSQGSPPFTACGTAFHGSASVEDCMTLSELPGNGNDAAITVTLGHTGSSTGAVTFSAPAFAASGSNGGISGTEGTGANAGTAGAGTDILYPDSTLHTWHVNSNNVDLGSMGTVIAKGTSAMNTAAVGSGACETVVTVSASGVATTDVIRASFNGDPTAVTGYGASASGAVLTIYPYPTANNVNFKVCNSSSGSITPSALTLNFQVVR